MALPDEIVQRAAQLGVAASDLAQPAAAAATAGDQVGPPPGDAQIRQDFLSGRAVAQRGAVDDGWEQLLGRGAPKPSGEPAPPVGTPGAGGGRPTPPAAAASTGSTASTLEQMALGRSPIGSKILSLAWGGVKDVGEGLVDAPRQIAGGALDWWNNLQSFAEDVAKQAQEAGVPDLVVSFTDDKGNWSPSVLSPQEALQRREAGTLGASLTLPTTGKPDTITGQILRFGTTFAIGRGSAGGPLAGVVSGIPGEIMRDFVSGATSQDVTQQRLSNLVDQFAPNAVTDFLKAKPEDEGTILGHIKSGLEYAGLGAIFSGVSRAIKTVKGALGGAEPAAEAEATGGAEELNALGGQREGPGLTGRLQPGVRVPTGATASGEQIMGLKPEGVTISPSTETDAERFLMGEIGENPVKINLDAINGPDDLKDAVSRISTFIKKQGAQSHDETRRLALSLGITPEQLAQGYKGELPTAAEMDAMNLIVQSGAKQVGDAAKVFLDPEVDAEGKYNALQTVAKQLIVQEQFENAKSEVARSLNILQARVGPHANYADALNKILVESNGDVESLMANVADLGNPEIGGDPQKVAMYLGRSLNSTTRDAMLKVYYNVLLSNPRTVVKKITSDVGMAMWNMATRETAENLPGASGEVVPGEGGALAYGYISSFKDAVRAAGRALVSGESQFYGEYQTLDAYGPGRLSAVADGAPGMLSTEQPTQSAMELLKSIAANGWKPTSWIGAADDFAKVWNYRAELYSLAFREASQNGATEEAAWEAAGNALDGIGTGDIPAAMHNQALSSALRNTFQEPLVGIGKWLQDGADMINLQIPHTEFKLPVGRILLPFVKVPYNIAKWSVLNSPLGLMNSNVRGELAAGGATADLAKARIALGSVAALGFADLALNTVVTGPGPRDPQLQRAWRAAGNEPYSIQLSKLGGPFAGTPPIGYNQVEPFGMMLGAIAATFDIMRFAKDDGRENLAASLSLGIGNAMLSKTYFQSMANFFNAMNNPERDGATWANSIASSMLVPRGVAGLATVIDPWARAHYDLMGKVESQIPFLSANLPPQRTLWGDPIPLRDGFLPFGPGALTAGLPISEGSAAVGRMISPVPLGRGMPVEPIDKWIWENRMDFPRGPSNQLGLSPPGQVQSFSISPGISVQIELTPEELDRFKVLAGNGLKDNATGLGAKDYLNSLVQGANPDADAQAQWNKATAGERALIVQKVVNTYRRNARTSLLQEFPDLMAAIRAGAEMRQQQLVGAGQQ